MGVSCIVQARCKPDSLNIFYLIGPLRSVAARGQTMYCSFKLVGKIIQCFPFVIQYPCFFFSWKNIFKVIPSKMNFLPRCPLKQTLMFYLVGQIYSMVCSLACVLMGSVPEHRCLGSCTFCRYCPGLVTFDLTQ